MPHFTDGVIQGLKVQLHAKGHRTPDAASEASRGRSPLRQRSVGEGRACGRSEALALRGGLSLTAPHGLMAKEKASGCLSAQGICAQTGPPLSAGKLPPLRTTVASL